MKIAYFGDKTHGGGIMEGSLIRGFNELGIQLYKYSPTESYDVVLIFNVATHNVQYSFDGIEEIDGHFAFIDTAEYGWWTHYRYYAKFYHSAFAPSAIKSRYTPAHLQLINFLRGKSFPYFLREYYDNVNYGKNYHPIDYPLYYLSVPKEGIDTFENFKSRY